MNLRSVYIPTAVLLLVLLHVSALADLRETKMKAFGDLCTRIQRGKGDIAENDLIQVLTEARELGCPFAAAAAVKSYSAMHPDLPQQLQLMVAENSFLAGDFRATVARYKNYLAKAGPGTESSDAATMMLTVLVDFLGAEDEAYLFMKGEGEKFWKSQSARRFDLWFLDMAIKKGDAVTYAERLLAVFSEKMPVERESFFYWDYLDWVMEAIRRPSAGYYPLVPVLRQLLPMVRADNTRLLKYSFALANLEFDAGRAEKTKEAVEASFAPVVAAAKAYFDAAPTLTVLQDVEYVFSSGFAGSVWQVCQKQKQDFFVSAFAKLSEDDRIAMIGWMPQNAAFIAAPEQWTQLCLTYPKAFAGAGQFVYPKSNAEVYKKQAPFLQGVPSTYAAVVNALAAGNDLDDMARHILEKESWHLGSNQCYDLIKNQIWPIFSSFPSVDGSKLPADYFSKFLVRFGSEQLMKSPVPMVDTGAAAEFVMAQWDYGDRGNLAVSLHMLDWIPYTDKERLAVFESSYNAFKVWAGKVSAAADARAVAEEKIKVFEQAGAIKKAAEAAKQAAEAKATQTAQAAAVPGVTNTVKAAADQAAAEAKKAAEAWVVADKQAAQAAGAASDVREALAKLKDVPVVSAAQISVMEEAFKAVLSTAVFNADKAPNPLCKSLALLVAAASDKKKADYEKIGREIYAQLRDFDIKKTPYGATIVGLVMQNRLASFDTLDFQLEALTDQLARWIPNATTQAVTVVRNAIVSGRQGWPSTAPQGDQANVQKFSDVMEKALLVQIDKDQLWPTLFNWFRESRCGSGWRDDDSGLVVMGKLIEKKTFLNMPYRLSGTTAAATYMWLVQNEFLKLQSQYPAASYFDDMYVEECSKSGKLDFAYWVYGSDSKGKVVNLATKNLQSYSVLPYTNKDVGGTNELWRWHGQCLAMDSNWRKTHAVDEAERGRLIAVLDAAFGKTRFDEFARGDYYFAADAGADTPEGRTALFQKLSAYAASAALAPNRVGPPSMSAVAKMNELSPAEINVLISFFPGLTPMQWSAGRLYECLPVLLYNGLLAGERYADLMRVVPYFWKMAKDVKNATLLRDMGNEATQLLEKMLADLAAKYSISGLDIVGTALPDDVRIALMGIRMKALVSIGATIPVDRQDPRYPIFAAQTAYLCGNLQNAWDLYLERPDQVAGMFKELDPDFSLWLIETNTETHDFKRAEELARGMMQWLDSITGGFDRELQARVMIAYADIAFTRQEFPKARALYEQIVAAKDFEGTKAKNDAELRIASVDRLTKNYDSAIARLEKLARRMDRGLQTESCYHLALIKYEQEDYAETARLLDQVFVLEPSHVAGKLLQGELNLKLKKYQSATDIDVGLSSSQRLIVPGKPLKVHLDDRNLAVAGKNSQVEVRVWTDSGDEELVSLLLSSDSKRKFEGRVPTTMAPVAKGDHVLQVLGNDTIYYDYSDAFKNANKVTGTRPMTMSVASDSILMVSSGKIVSEEEEEKQVFEQFMDQVRRAEDLSRALAESRTNAIVRPGNKIYVRVVDLDQSTTSNKDAVAVKVATYSGDSIPEVALRETEAHSGVFEGEIPTTSAGALAYASDSNEGRLPFYAISAGAFPPWVALSDNVRPKSFSVDLNDNVVLGNMNVLTDVAGRKLKAFFVQTSFDNKNFMTVASWPEAYKSWDGTPGFEFVSVADKAPVSAESIRQYIESDSIGKPVQRAVVPLSQMIAGSNADLVAFNLDKVPVGGSRYAAHFRAAFYLLARQTKLFKLDLKKDGKSLQWFFAIDGEESENRTRANIIKRQFKKGVHFLDIYISGSQDDKGTFELSVDSPEPPYLVPCPRSLFDPSASAEIRGSIPDRSATITPKEDQTSFDIKFAPDTRGRVIRLVMADFETDGPAIRKIFLTSGDGKQLLPTETDFVAACKNDVLEIVAGDKISIIYEDPKVVTKGKEVQERSMSANYRNGEIYACCAYDATARVPQYISLFRFVSGEKFDVLIDDPDRDVTDKPDVVAFSAKTELGEPVTFRALETDVHSGRFFGSVFTVKGKPTRPNDLQVEPEENVVLSYEDAENMDPGIPWTRKYTVEQVTYDPPEFRVYDVTSIPLSEDQMAELRDPSKAGSLTAANRQEYIMPTSDLIATRPVKVEPSTPARIIAEGPLLVELTYPTVALASNSVVAICVQTLSARKAAGTAETNGFDPGIPGTIQVKSQPSEFGTIAPPLGYLSVLVRGDPYASSSLRDGRFSFDVKKVFGTVEGDTEAFGATDSQVLGAGAKESTLFMQSDDEIFVAFPYKDLTGATNWIVQRVVMTSDMFMDVMDRYYRETVDSIFVGENLYLRVNHRAQDTTEKKDTVSVAVKTGSGFATSVTLVESFEHTGSFKGLIKPVYFEDTPALANPGAVPVKYGDTITITYQPVGTNVCLTRSILIHKGADGAAIPFTKQFKDPEVAVQTQFTTAEAFFELAKKHRALDQTSLARREIAQGKKMLEEAIKDYPNIETRAQADYLLADLALEYANDAVDEKIKQGKYLEAVNLFTEVIMSYPDSVYAPKAQYKKALTFEKMGQIDMACEEYVKLSYMYPDNELVAETIARLGSYFSTKGKEFEAKAKEAKTEDARQEQLAKAKAMFKTAAEVFNRLAPRFPTHELAGKTMVLSGQCYMRGEDFTKAALVLEDVTKKYEGDHELVAEAMYWRGDAFMKLKNYEDAYRQFKKLTWDYPASKWAKFARGRLTEPELDSIHKTEME